MVLAIGRLLRRTLRAYSVSVGDIYLFARQFESLVLLSIVLNLIPGLSIPHDSGYFFAMLVLGLGSIPMCITLYKQGLLPSWLAIWGAVGYAAFSFGCIMELFGRQRSMLVAPGGLWEIAFALWLIIRRGRKSFVRRGRKPLP